MLDQIECQEHDGTVQTVLCKVVHLLTLLKVNRDHSSRRATKIIINDVDIYEIRTPVSWKLNTRAAQRRRSRIKR